MKVTAVAILGILLVGACAPATPEEDPPPQEDPEPVVLSPQQEERCAKIGELAKTVMDIRQQDDSASWYVHEGRMPGFRAIAPLAWDKPLEYKQEDKDRAALKLKQFYLDLCHEYPAAAPQILFGGEPEDYP